MENLVSPDFHVPTEPDVFDVLNNQESLILSTMDDGEFQNLCTVYGGTLEMDRLQVYLSADDIIYIGLWISSSRGRSVNSFACEGISVVEYDVI